MSYVTPEAFNDLYFDFTGHAHPGYPKDRSSIAHDLSVALARGSGANAPGPLVVATATGIYAYDAGGGHALLGGASFRATANTGFYEITGISHVGPAIAYLATMQRLGNDTWQTHIDPLISHLRAVRQVNAIPMPEHWLSTLACPAWVGRESQIKNLVDYACALAGNYLAKVQANSNRLSPSDVIEQFLSISNAEFPIPYNTIMIGTFALEAIKSAYEIYTALHDAHIDWQRAKVILHNQAGSNYSAGLTSGTNWVHPTLLAIAGGALSPDRVMIAPYAPIPRGVGTLALADDDFDFLANQVWGQLYARPQVTQLAFSNVSDMFVAGRSKIPGDYGFTRADQIDHFIMRLKYSTSNVAEMQSNTIGFWMGGEAVAKGWDVSKIDIPGLTHGLPSGCDGYPSNATAIPEPNNS